MTFELHEIGLCVGAFELQEIGLCVGAHDCLAVVDCDLINEGGGVDETFTPTSSSVTEIPLHCKSLLVGNVLDASPTRAMCTNAGLAPASSCKSCKTYCHEVAPSETLPIASGL